MLQPVIHTRRYSDARAENYGESLNEELVDYLVNNVQTDYGHRHTAGSFQSLSLKMLEKVITSAQPRNCRG